MAAWLRTSAEKARAAMESATEQVGRRMGLEDYQTLFASDPETGYAVRSVALLRCVAQLTPARRLTKRANDNLRFAARHAARTPSRCRPRWRSTSAPSSPACKAASWSLA